MHLSDGELRAYLDNQPVKLTIEQIRAHLAGCTQCNSRLVMLSERVEEVSNHLSTLGSTRHAPSARAALARLQIQILEKEKTNMWKKPFSQRYRFAWVALGLVIILAVALTVPSVGAIANSFLGLFRVQQVTFVPVNPGDLPERLGSSSQFEALLSQNLQVEEHGKTQNVASAGEAGQLAGIAVRLPAQIEGQPDLFVQPAASATFNVDLNRIQAILGELGRSDIKLPAELDGAAVTLELPAAVTALYGSCKADLEAAQQQGYGPDDPGIARRSDCTTLVQMPSPSISAPPGLDVAGLGQAYLQVLGMTPEEAASFSQNVDWTTTLVIPVPRYGTTYQEVMVDGATGTLIQQAGDFEYLLLWVKDGTVYALSGQGNAQTALEIGNSLK